MRVGTMDCRADNGEHVALETEYQTKISKKCKIIPGWKGGKWWARRPVGTARGESGQSPGWHFYKRYIFFLPDGSRLVPQDSGPLALCPFDHGVHGLLNSNKKYM